MKKKYLITIALFLCILLVGCGKNDQDTSLFKKDQIAPVLSGIDSVVEIDCGDEMNIFDYVAENLKISDDTSEEIVEYSLSELEHEITCAELNFDSTNGTVDTSKTGNYYINISVKDLDGNEGTYTYTLYIKPLIVTADFEELIEMDCGTPFNALDYIKDKTKITNQSGEKEYNLDNFDYEINCDNKVYDANSGNIDTRHWGKYTVSLKLNTESFENNTFSFDVKLNPLKIEKGVNVFEKYGGGYEYEGFCEYKNTSVDPLEISSIRFQYFDKDDILISTGDYPESSLKYVASENSGYARELFASWDFPLQDSDEIERVEVEIEYTEPSKEDTTLIVGDMEISETNGFGGVAIVENPYDKDAEYLNFCAGMYDAEGNLIGVMQSYDSAKIPALSKARVSVSWYIDSMEIPKQTVSLKATGSVSGFADE